LVRKRIETARRSPDGSEPIDQAITVGPERRSGRLLGVFEVGSIDQAITVGPERRSGRLLGVFEAGSIAQAIALTQKRFETALGSPGRSESIDQAISATPAHVLPPQRSASARAAAREAPGSRRHQRAPSVACDRPFKRSLSRGGSPTPWAA
jgi:hypothetical protein